jgi:hypothetical protein
LEIGSFFVVGGWGFSGKNADCKQIANLYHTKVISSWFGYFLGTFFQTDLQLLLA